MKINQPSYSEQDIRNVLRICADLGKISKEQAQYIESMMNFQHRQNECDKRNKKPLWKRFCGDLKALLEDYAVFIDLGRINAQIVFYEDSYCSWNMQIWRAISPEEVKEWPGIYERQRKALDIFNKLPQNQQTLDIHQQLMADARRKAGIFAPKNKKQK